MTGSARLEGATLAFDDTGQGPPVLLVHGFPATRKLWEPVAARLAAAGFRTLAPDLAGYGDSQAAPGVRVDMASQARWLLALLDRLGIERAAVVAHDVGSAAAQILAATAPARLRCLVVLDGVCRGEWAMEAVESIQRWAPADAARLQPVLLRRLAKSGPMREVLAAYAGEEGGLRLIRAARDLDPAQTTSLDEALRRAGLPALVLWGERDAFLSPEAVGRPLAELLGARLQLLPGAHFTPLDCPAEVAAALLPFLAGLPAAA